MKFMPKTIKLSSLLVLSLALIFSTFISRHGVSAAPVGSMYFTQTNTMVSGTVFDVAVRVNSGDTVVNVAESYFTYPTSLLSFAGIDVAGSAFDSTAQADESSGTVNIVLGSTPGVAGDLLVAHIRFNVLSTGTANLIFQNNSRLYKKADSTNMLNSFINGSYIGQGPRVIVHRLYNPKTYIHLWTTSQADIDAATQHAGYKYEGIAFYAPAAPAQDTMLVHRMYNPKTYLHLWSTSQADIDAATQHAGYKYEGIAYNSATAASPGAILVHRLYNPKTYIHFWSTSQADIDAATQHAGYKYEGIAYYALEQ